METLLMILIYLVVLGLVYYLLNLAIDLLPIDPVFKNICKVVIILVIIFVLLEIVFQGGHLPTIKIR